MKVSIPNFFATLTPLPLISSACASCCITCIWHSFATPTFCRCYILAVSDGVIQFSHLSNILQGFPKVLCQFKSLHTWHNPYDSLMSRTFRNVSKHQLLHVPFKPKVCSMSSIVIAVILPVGVFFGPTTTLISSTGPTFIHSGIRSSICSRTVNVLR